MWRPQREYGKSCNQERLAAPEDSCVSFEVSSLGVVCCCEIIDWLREGVQYTNSSIKYEQTYKPFVDCSKEGRLPTKLQVGRARRWQYVSLVSSLGVAVVVGALFETISLQYFYFVYGVVWHCLLSASESSTFARHIWYRETIIVLMCAKELDVCKRAGTWPHPTLLLLALNCGPACGFGGSCVFWTIDAWCVLLQVCRLTGRESIFIDVSLEECRRCEIKWKLSALKGMLVSYEMPSLGITAKAYCGLWGEIMCGVLCCLICCTPYFQ